jgi:hypothetical protein
MYVCMYVWMNIYSAWFSYISAFQPSHVQYKRTVFLKEALLSCLKESRLQAASIPASY